MSSTTPAPLTPDARQAVIDAEVAKAVRDGWTVQSVSAGQAVLSRTKRIGLLLNLLLVLVTGGLWLIWIIYRALNRKTKTLIVSVDTYGRVTRS